MRYSHLIALTNFVEGREEDYNDWYTWVHLRDVMSLAFGVIAAQRFKKSGYQVTPGGSSRYNQPYLCIYETTDPEEMTRAHEPVFTDKMPISDAYSLENACELYFDELAGFTMTPGSFPRADVVLERVQQDTCSAELLEWYVENRLPGMKLLPGITAASCGTLSDHQLFEQQNIPGLCAIYWTTDLAATVDAWSPLAGMAPGDFGDTDISVDCYSAVIDRLTMVQVRNPDDTELETARTMRQALGDRVLSGPPDDVKSDLFNQSR